MKFIKYTFILLTFLFIQNLNAQVPGYYGKRFDIQYQPSLGSLILGDWIEKGAYDNYRYDALQKEKALLFNLEHNLAFNYIIKKRHSIGLIVSKYRTGIAYTYSNDSIYVRASQNIKGTMYLLQYKRFKRSIAPLGRYGGWILGMNRMNYEIKDREEQLITSNKVTFLVFGYQSGRQYFIKNGLFINLGYTVLLQSAISTNDDFQNNIELNTRNLLFNVLRVHVGVGYMLF